MGKKKSKTNKTKKIQFSKVITLFILSMITISWLIGLFIYWDELDYYNYILEYTQNMAIGVLPYFCLSAADRLVYFQQAKYQNEEA